jgi:hypothetical protein
MSSFDTIATGIIFVSIFISFSVITIVFSVCMLEEYFNISSTFKRWKIKRDVEKEIKLSRKP